MRSVAVGGWVVQVARTDTEKIGHEKARKRHKTPDARLKTNSAIEDRGQGKKINHLYSRYHRCEHELTRSFLSAWRSR